ncbi:hypothetical protein [Streptomyces sp. AMCC400023]|uniref:hypothetical protein n=1 Tax=Streptomyces sp. AMCC400023 TaxID=2056258 RepID=UPI001F2F9258|nr:hypothetical protein [Streptomyces sp. AMCC400023]UJV42938.1 hypothetical protein CVT30_26625 [Streptomyces sp. AMCC400023]
MTATDLVARLQQEPATDTARGILPPYSGRYTVCPKCLYGEAYTRYRQATHRPTVVEWNGVATARGPLPERHERECEHCSYTWEEALVTEEPGMTVDALAHALHHCTPYPVELDRDAREHTARELLAVLRIAARPEHPLWQYSTGTAPAAPPPAPVCEAVHETTEENDR